VKRVAVTLGTSQRGKHWIGLQRLIAATVVAKTIKK